ncbi:hypothetical protein [Cellulosimicrobium funkei]|uniref:hypothetical protein n=1 Tax=Cellulosimicrobium funkei TaxID=264251 RepID=UPI003D749520
MRNTAHASSSAGRDAPAETRWAHLVRASEIVNDLGDLLGNELSSGSGVVEVVQDTLSQVAYRVGNHVVTFSYGEPGVNSPEIQPDFRALKQLNEDYPRDPVFKITPSAI